ncbi:hypothetical protein ACFYRJ_41450 [Streptomyces sp. NPDC005531]|uniref:hypothetical protein n=1 Tax=Streptomyces sp. NPDC005531 TaxID=3364722 RepID=UPI00367BC122
MGDGNVQFSVVIATGLITVWLCEDGDPYNMMLDYEVVEGSARGDQHASLIVTPDDAHRPVANVTYVESPALVRSGHGRQPQGVEQTPGARVEDEQVGADPATRVLPREERVAYDVHPAVGDLGEPVLLAGRRSQLPSKVSVPGAVGAQESVVVLLGSVTGVDGGQYDAASRGDRIPRIRGSERARSAPWRFTSSS